MRLSAIVAASEGGLVAVGTPAGDPEVTAVITTDLLDPRRYLAGGELVLTGLAWWQPERPGRARGFVAALVGGGAVALAAGDAELGSVPEDLVAACAEAGLPLLRVPVAYSFAAVTDRAVRHLTGREDLGAVLARHRVLIAAMAAREAAGSGLDGVLGVVSAELDLPCWVLSPTGRRLAGTELTEPQSGQQQSGQQQSGRLARQFLRAPHLPHLADGPHDRPMSLLAAGPAAPAPRAWSWILAVAEDHTTWTAERRTVVAELASLVALEADLSRRFTESQRLLGAALAGPSAAEVDRAARACGVDPSSSSMVVLANGPLAAVVLAEALPGRAGAGWALAEIDGAVIAVGALPADLVDRLRATITALAPGLGPEPLRIGVSDPVSGAAGLLGAVAEARAAALTGDLGTPYSVAGPERLSSHALLLAAVPAELREAYRTRVLGPLLDHDRKHRTELVHTLRTYLDCSGSWSRCAAEMHVHVNTLRYRIDRIQALTGRDLRRLEDQTDLLLALNLP